MSTPSFPVHLGRYTLVDSLGTGGMGTVFLALQSGAEDFRRYVAVKTLLPSYRHNQAMAALFVQEAKTLATANHPNVVQTYDLFRHDDTMYLALEFIHGRDLLQVLAALRERQATMAPRLVCDIIAEVARGLHYIHQFRGLDGAPRHLVHRDINPKNILLGFDGGTKIADFGLLRSAADHDETPLRGTLGYVAPEQIRGDIADRRADIFSLGCVLFELLALTPLFGDTESTQIALRREHVVPDCTTLLPTPHHAFLPILRRMLTADPADRYPDVAAVLADVEALAATLPPAPQAQLQLLQQLFPHAAQAWNERQAYYLSASVSEFDASTTGPMVVPPEFGTPTMLRAPKVYQKETVGILSRSILYVAVLALVSLSVAGLLYVAATLPMPLNQAAISQAPE